MVKKLPASKGDVRDAIQSLGRADPLEEGWQLTSALLPGESHGQWSLAGYVQSMRSQELDTTELLSTHICKYIIIKHK